MMDMLNLENLLKNDVKKIHSWINSYGNDSERWQQYA
jgi:hypothetical protein